MTLREARVLVVDDNEALRDNIAEILQTGCSDYRVDVRCAATAREALAIAKEATPELALLDLHLPDIEATRVIEDLGELSPHIQVVIVTGDSAVESAIDALAHGAFSYVLKPFKIPALVEIAKSGIERASLLREGDRLRREIEASESRHREVFESVPAYVVALNEARQITLWNRQLEKATGYTRSEMLGRTADFVDAHPDGSRLPSKRKKPVYARWRLAELPADLDHQSLTYAVGVDITEERALAVRARRAERLAAVGTLAAGLAHEVRNPLNSASLQLEVLTRKMKKAGVYDDMKPTLDVVQGEIERLDRLVSEFLRFARPIPLKLGPMALNDELRAMAELLEPEAVAENVEITMSLDPDLPTVQGESERMRQVLINLMRNSVEAMHGPGGKLLLETTHDDENVYVRVTDTGPGFEEEAPVFDAFFTTKHQGTGLGLAIVHRIVGDHGGNISVSSRPGRTCFELQLPNLPPDSR